MVDPEPQLAVLGFFGHQLSSWTPAVPLCPSMLKSLLEHSTFVC